LELSSSCFVILLPHGFYSLQLEDLSNKSFYKMCIYLLVQMKSSWMVFIVVNQCVPKRSGVVEIGSIDIMSAISKLIKLWGMGQWIVFLGLVMFLKLSFKLFKFLWKLFIRIGLGKMIIRFHSFSSYQILAQNLFSPFTRKDAWKGVILYFEFFKKTIQHHIH
jgi:hypothetical protein